VPVPMWGLLDPRIHECFQRSAEVRHITSDGCQLVNASGCGDQCVHGMDGFADGLNFYLYKHPEVKPRVITKFEPWMALSFSEGSIGGDIESIDLDELRRFYGDTASRPSPMDSTRRATLKSESNGFAIAPAVDSTTTNAHLHTCSITCTPA